MRDSGAAICLDAFREAIRPEAPMTVDQWADAHRVLSQKASAEPGLWRTSRVPMMREVMQCLSASSHYNIVTLMKGSQTSGSEVGFNWVGYSIHRSPGPMMIVQPTVELAERVSKQRIAPMIEECAALRERVRETRSRDSGNTLLTKEFPGGMLLLAGANSAAPLRSVPIAKLMLDELDAYPKDVDGEGAPAELAERRTATFRRRKIFKVSSPTIKGDSPIEAAFLDGDQRRYHVPCPHCGHFQVLKWAKVRWDKDAKGKPKLATVRYECDAEACKLAIEEHAKTGMLAAGKWIAENPGAPSASFHLSALYSPLGWYSWADAVTDWAKAQGNPAKLKVFVNTVLGETFEIRGEDAPEWRDIYARREERIMGRVPRRAVVLTAAVDVQKDRLEATVVGWNRRESWIVDHVVLVGDTSLPPGHGPWRQLDELLDKDFARDGEGGAMRLRLTLIDSGYQTSQVYGYVASRAPGTIRAIKGQDTLAMPIGSPAKVELRASGSSRRKRGGRVWPVGTNLLKTDVMGRLKQRRPTDEEIGKLGWPPTYVHFPTLDEEYFKQLTAEQLILVKDKRGFAKYQWVKTYPNNEALDLFCYNVAAWYGAGLAKLTDADWSALEIELGMEPSTEPAPKQVAPAPKPADTKPPAAHRPASRPTSSFWDRGRR